MMTCGLKWHNYRKKKNGEHWKRYEKKGKGWVWFSRHFSLINCPVAYFICIFTSVVKERKMNEMTTVSITEV